MALPPEEKPPSAFYPADNAAVIAHLNYLQAIITRLAGNSAQCKTWCLAIVSALFSFAGALKNDNIVAYAIIPIVIFCMVDAAYLGREKSYRQLYNSVATKIRAGTYTRGDCFDLTPTAGTGHYSKALCSWSIWPIYLGLIAGYALLRMSGLLM
ncbi:hypothetical protein [Bradyrhizobium sp. AUGA SZCCT0160]|uniref:hypothetical protein n=1 Tax=Bradyrhizobium sp. AUGA SZCCT0160 TaxID=2807662 RepID=UPI001BAA7AE3|nr:hypothetical protein [Bradyrhizobium sp. AUGA SZCCT0160]MBR1191441.1 hypothetical protein [Bradyrhizobium sp. AUGA SZCCT0160]